MAQIEAIDVHCHVISPDREKYPLAPIGRQAERLVFGALADAGAIDSGHGRSRA